MEPEAQTQNAELAPVPIWRCKSSECKAWIREEMASAPSPECPLCKGMMLRSMKHLPKLVKRHKTQKKQTFLLH